MQICRVLKFVAIVVLALVVYARAEGNAPDKADWESFKSFHSKKYESLEHELKHKANFHKNAAAVEAHNKAYHEGKVSYTTELNAFSDQDPEEFRRIRNGYKPELKNRDSASGLNPNQVQSESSPLAKREALEESFDWRDKGGVSPVKDQGQCGSCWAFATVATMESQALINNKKNLTFSEEQLVDCDLFSGDMGCQGGLYDNAWGYIKKSGGIDSDQDYGYFAGSIGTGLFCRSWLYKPKATATDFHHVNSSSDTAVMEALVTKGPLAVCIDASKLSPYSGGIYTCDGPIGIDHAVTLVGYGTSTTTGEEYWIIKNSWGEKWGLGGFFLLSRESGKNCGLTGDERSDPAYPDVQLK